MARGRARDANTSNQSPVTFSLATSSSDTGLMLYVSLGRKVCPHFHHQKAKSSVLCDTRLLLDEL